MQTTSFHQAMSHDMILMAPDYGSGPGYRRKTALQGRHAAINQWLLKDGH